MPKVIKPWTKLEERRAVELRAARHTIASVARTLGRSYGSVSMKLSLLGVTTARPTRRGRGEFLEAVRRACRKGRSDVRIAEALKSTPQEVFKARKKLGIKAGVTYSEAASWKKQRRPIRCWLCNVGTHKGSVKGWQFRKLPMRGKVHETYCPECFGKWGWPTLPDCIPARESRSCEK